MYAVMKCLCKGIPPDSVDDYIRMAASTIYYYIKKFCDAIMFGFNAEYMRRPTVNDTKWMMKEKCLVTSTVCIGVGGWFWHGYFGVGGSNNDLNVLKSSNLFDDNLNGVAPLCHFTINGNQYTHGYYLVDGIYKSYFVLFQAYGAPSGIQILKLFNKYQMDKRKDVERDFGTLQSKFRILYYKRNYWEKQDMKSIMRTCLILHNIIVEDEHRDPLWKYVPDPPHAPIVGTLRQTSEALQNPVLQERLRTDLAAHIWERHGQGISDGDIPGDTIDNELDSGEDTDEVDVDQDHYDPGQVFLASDSD
ncbi:uncharacterized protein LOC113305929 [Papaver somniferum]|uniref:uncharacterized protein LOC113305929 n=1 Tax=Papaver somniferum TaxID=3469 RepID=UPI000E706053|nr:uncharacterized protein LOC113305929 [Papaver somniferum]